MAVSSQWNASKPAMANQISADVPDIEENFEEIERILEAITNGTLGTTDSDLYKVDVIADDAIAVASLASGAMHVVTAKSSNYSVLAADLKGNTLFTNTGASGEITLALPAGAANYSFGAYVTTAQYLKITANGTEKFRYLATQGAAGGYIRINVVGRYVWCVWSGTEWVIINIQGAWNLDE